MNLKTSLVLAVLAVSSLGVLVGCNKPADGTKKPAPAPAPVPANTTDSK